MSVSSYSRFALIWVLCLPLWLPRATPVLAAQPPSIVLSANPSVRGLEPARGQRYVRLVPLNDGRVVMLYTVGYPLQCGLLKPCKQQSEVWHLVFDQRGIVAPPRRTSPALDAKPNLNSGSVISGWGTPYGDGSSAVFGLGHSSHNAGGSYFVRIDGEGRVLGLVGGEGSYAGRACALDRDVIVPTMWVDPVTHGYLWYENATTLTATVNLGGYGYNYQTHQDFTCGRSAALNGNFALLLRKEPKSHLGFSLYRAPGKRWTMVADEVRVPASKLPAARYLAAGGLMVGDDRGVAMFRDATLDGRRNMFYVRFRIATQGIVLVDKEPRAMPASDAYEAVDGNLTYGGKGRFYLVMHQGGESATGQADSRRQAVRFYGLDFDSGSLQEIAPAYEDAHWSGKAPLSYYAESLNQEAFTLARSCDGNLYVGGAIDGGKGISELKVFSIPVGSNSCR